MPPAKPGSDVISANLRMMVGPLRVETRLEVSPRPIKPQQALPTLMRLVNAVVDETEKEVERKGLKISCTKGCGACCRQLVPISDVEAHHLRAVVDAMPPSRRKAVEERFAAASRRLQEAGLKDYLMAPTRQTADEATAFGLKYYELDLACPFLEDESCSIHQDRPLVCREYLVTSPAANCSRLAEGEIDPVEVPKMSALARTLTDPAGQQSTRWVALSLALEWVADHPERFPLKTGPEWIDAFLKAVSTIPRPDTVPAASPPRPTAARPTLELAIPSGEVTALAVMPVVRQLSEHAIGAAVAAVERGGKSISCREGCAACCRQAVPLADVEAWALGDLIEAMPEPRRAVVRQRLAEAERKLDAAAIAMLDVHGHSSDEYRRLARSYFDLRLDCPFLDNERCSIHASRPLACREHIVTSLPQHCWTVDGGLVEGVRSPPLAGALLRLTSEDTPPRPRATLLPLLLRWLALNPKPTAVRPAQKWIERLMSIQSALTKGDGGKAAS
ncbi:MAG: YkgJ family cysteine cluster protein [Alphaproteobacteria bacterium]|nr:YkgJ family cysteine cluster protein [Alphaproteobacteria bacterium]